MSDHTFGGYNGTDFAVVGGGAPGVGSHVRLDSGWSSSVDAFTFVVTDSTDSTFDQSSAGQSGTLHDANGTPISTGAVNLSGWGAVLDDGNGNTVSIYEVHVDGQLVGYVSDGEVVPGVDYQITVVLSVGTPGLSYDSLHSSTYEQSEANDVDGGAYDDQIEGGDGDDTLDGWDGDDTIHGGSGNDTLTGHGGNDTLDGGAGNDTLYGMEGDDTLYTSDGVDHLHGGEGSDRFVVTENEGIDNIYAGEDGGAGDDHDVIDFSGAAGGASVTFTHWESGQYTLTGTTGNFYEIEEVQGSEHADIIDASAQGAAITISGNGGDDTLTGGTDGDTISGGAGDDIITGNAGDDTLSGDAGHDSIRGGTGNDILIGGTGDDTFLIAEGDGADTITGGDDSDDIVFTGGGVSVSFSGDGTGSWVYAGSSGSFSEIEEVTGTQGSDTLDASQTSSGITLSGGGGDDTVIGGAGDDVLDGGSGSDTLTGGEGADTISGGGSHDEIYGGAGDDVIDAGSGHDEIYGGAGDDNITTGSGYDIIFVQPGDGNDTIVDFDTTIDGGVTIDQLDISAMGGVTGYDLTVTDDGSGNAVVTFPTGESLTFLGLSPEDMTVGQMQTMGIPCFTSGTRIDTPAGPVPVERLRPGDIVLTDRGPEPLLWAAHRDCGPDLLAARPELKPVVVAGQKVSRQHCFLARVDGKEWLVRARHLALEGIAGARVAEGCRRVRYHHLLLPRHGLLRAGGLWQESFYPGPWALRCLDPRALVALVAGWPALGTVLAGAAPEAAYGPPARPVMPRAMLRALPSAARAELLAPRAIPLAV